MSTTRLFHCLRYADPLAARSFLTALGFTETAFVTDSEHPGIVRHAQFRWRDTGGVMMGSPRADGSTPATGAGRCYLVVGTDEEVDRIHQRALSAGGTSVESPREADYGGRGCTVADGEGNQWSIGTYAGE